MRALTERTSMSGQRLSTVLRALEHREPPLVAKDIDAGLGTQFWWATQEAAEII